MPVFDKSARKDGTSRARTSPTITTGMSTSAGGQDAHLHGYAGKRRHDTPLSRHNHCDACPMKPRCSPKTPARKVPRSIYESARDRARDIAKTDEGRASRKLRKKIEMLFAISSASYASIGSDYEGRMVRVTSSISQPRPEPQQACQAHPDAGTAAEIKRLPPTSPGFASHTRALLHADFLNDIRQKQPSSLLRGVQVKLYRRDQPWSQRQKRMNRPSFRREGIKKSGPKAHGSWPSRKRLGSAAERARIGLGTIPEASLRLKLTRFSGRHSSSAAEGANRKPRYHAVCSRTKRTRPLSVSFDWRTM